MGSAEKPDSKKGFKIINKILVAMLVVAIIPLSGLYYLSIHKAKKDWTENIHGKLELKAKYIVMNIDSWINFNLALLDQNTLTPSLASMNPVHQNPVLKSIQDVYRWIYLVFTVAPDGENIGRSDGKSGSYYGDRTYFTEVMRGMPLGKQVLIGKTSRKPALILAKPIRSKGAENVGVLATAMTLDDLSQSVTNARIGKTGFAVLLDERNRLVAHGKKSIISELQSFESHPAIKNKPRPGYLLTYKENGKKVVAVTEKTDFGWTLIVQQDYDEAFQSANSAIRIAIFVLLITVAIVVLISFLLASQLSTPIQNLTKVVDRISRGEIDLEIEGTQRGDEIGALARAVKRMKISLKMAFDQLRAKRKS